jgi:hypothetical protein
VATTDINIERYIEATRFNLKNRIFVELYENHYFPPLQTTAADFGISLKIVVAYSYTRRAEFVSIGSDSWLIYDQYMGQTMNLLNRIFIEAEDARPAACYLHKIIAERCLESGALAEALFCAKVYDSQRELLNPKRRDEILRSTFTEAQERFYLNHELGHLVQGLHHPRVELILDHVNDLLSQKRQAFENSNFESIMSGFAMAPPIARHDESLDVLSEEIKKEFETEGESSYRKSYLAAFNENDLKQEVFCDVFAADFVIASHRTNEKSMQEAIRAVYVGFYHLQALSFIEQKFRWSADGLNRWRDRFIPVQIRSHCLRSHMLFLYKLILSSQGQFEGGEIDSKVNEMSLQLMADQERYYYVIFDQALNLAGYLAEDDKLQKMGQAELQRHSSELKKYDAEELNLVLSLSIRLLTGWIAKGSATSLLK